MNEQVTITLRGYNGPGWELSVTGRKAWANKMVKRIVPEVQALADRIGTRTPTQSDKKSQSNISQ